jgi:hypothetical protein
MRCGRPERDGRNVHDSTAVDESIDLWWLVHKRDNNPSHEDAISDCVENSSLKIDNG